jgi:Flp pilus assembly pilin Flp
MSAIKHFSAWVRGSARGQTMAEYALILLAVAVIVYVSYQTFGTTINSDVTSVNNLF